MDETELVYSRKPACTIRYVYDSADILKERRIESGEFKQKYKYTLGTDGTRIVTLPGEEESQYNTDHFGRKTSDELKFAGGFLTRKYTYQPGQVTAEHIQHKKIRSEATTRLVDTITYTSSFAGRGLTENPLHGRVIRYTYDGEQRITQVTDSVEGSTQYTYNELGQLTWEGKDNEGTTVVYDAYGNIESKGGIAYTYSSTYRDRLIGYGGETIEYSGTSPNPTVYRGWNLNWNKGGQLAGASRDGKAIEFTYNIGNVRTQRSVNGKKYRYIVDGTRILRDEYKGVDYLYDSEGKVCGMVYEEETYYFAKNLQGDVISITRDTGLEIARYSYDAWGKCTITAAVETWQEVAEANVYRYRSYVYDSDLGLYYLHNRYYDPQVGRFISEDPARDGTNWYAYCGSDAVNYVDPDGLWRKVGETIWEAESGDTLSWLAMYLYNNANEWWRFGFQYEPATLRSGDIIDVTGRGLVGHNYGSYVEYFGSVQVYPVAEEVPIYGYDPAPSVNHAPPPKPTASGGSSNPTPAKPNPDSVSSTSGPGGSKKPSKENNSSPAIKIDPNTGYPVDFIGPILPDPGKTNQDIWDSDSNLGPLLDDLGINIEIDGPETVYDSPSKIKTLLGYEFKITVSVAWVLGTGPLTIGTNTKLEGVTSIEAKFGDFSAIFDTEYSIIQFTHAINDEWAVSLGYKWSWFTSYYYIAVGYSPKNTTFAVTYTLYVTKQDWKHLLIKGGIALAIIFSPAILSALTTATAGTAAASLVPIFQQYAFS